MKLDTCLDEKGKVYIPHQMNQLFFGPLRTPKKRIILESALRKNIKASEKIRKHYKKNGWNRLAVLRKEVFMFEKLQNLIFDTGILDNKKLKFLIVYPPALHVQVNSFITDKLLHYDELLDLIGQKIYDTIRFRGRVEHYYEGRYVRVDNTNKFLIPKEYRNFADIDVLGKVKLVFREFGVEIWNIENWEKTNKFLKVFYDDFHLERVKVDRNIYMLQSKRIPPKIWHIKIGERKVKIGPTKGLDI